MIDISIITINYNGQNDTCALIETIPQKDYLEVIVVDNASKNQEADTIATRYPHVKVIKSVVYLSSPSITTGLKTPVH